MCAFVLHSEAHPPSGFHSNLAHARLIVADNLSETFMNQSSKFSFSAEILNQRADLKSYKLSNTRNRRKSVEEIADEKRNVMNSNDG